MDKRTLIAVVLSVADFYVFSAIYGPKPDVKTVQTANSESQSLPVEPTPAPVSQSLQTTVNSEVVKPVTDAVDVTVETDLYSAVFSSKGAVLKKLVLKKFRENNKQESQLVTLFTKADPSAPAFSTTASGFSLPIDALYSPSTVSLNLSESTKEQLVFTFIDPQGYVIRKVYSFSGSDYAIGLDTHIINNGSTVLNGSIIQSLTMPFDPPQKDGRYELYGASLYADSKLLTDVPKNVSSASKRYDNTIVWASLNDKYFISSLLAVNNNIASAELKKNKSGFLQLDIFSPGFSVAPGQSMTVSNKIYAGPKQIDILKTQGNSLEQALDLGWFSAIAKPMLYSLKFFYRYVGNYGFSIIIITFILKIFFFPLTHKSYKSMKQMGNLQPKMVALKEKYKNDRDAMNRAIMELYRDNKVNPLGGCLPMIVQIPVFFALYKALMFSIELRHAPFMLWITDLSDKDPYYVTPVIMGATMFIQQKLTPSNMDEMQQKIMLGLPVIFTFMFLNFPSGLVLYWLINNILTIAQQIYINKLVK